MPRCGLFIGMRYPQQEFFSKRPGAELQADGEVIGRKSTGDRDGRQRRQGITASIGAPKKEPRPNIVSVDERRGKGRMSGWRGWRCSRDQHVHLTQGLQNCWRSRTRALRARLYTLAGTRAAAWSRVREARSSSAARVRRMSSRAPAPSVSATPTKIAPASATRGMETACTSAPCCRNTSTALWIACLTSGCMPASSSNSRIRPRRTPRRPHPKRLV